MLYAADAVFQHYSIRKVYIFTIGIVVQVNLIDHDEDGELHLKHLPRNGMWTTVWFI